MPSPQFPIAGDANGGACECVCVCVCGCEPYKNVWKDAICQGDAVAADRVVQWTIIIYSFIHQNVHWQRTY